MSNDPRLPYVVRGRRKNGIRTYFCPTPQWALRKFRDFEKAEYEDIAALGPDGPISAAELVRLVEGGVGGAPVDVDAPMAPEMAI